MAIGYTEQVVRRFYAAATLAKNNVVKLHTTLGQVNVCGDNEKAIGIAKGAANLGDLVDVVLEGEHFAVASEPIAVGATVVGAASGEIRTGISTDNYILGNLGPDQAAAVTNDLVAVYIQKGVLAIA